MKIVASDVAKLSQLLSGRLYISSTIGPDQELIVLSMNKPDFEKDPLPAPPFSYAVHRLAPDGWQVVFSVPPR